MLSKISVLILGIIDEKPVNPYEITKLLDYIHIKDWFPIASSSVYATIKTLSQRSYITGESKREGNMPEKTVYSITPKGKEVLYKSLIDYLSSLDLDAVKFNIASIMICHLTQKEVLDTLNTRVIRLNAFLSGLRHQLSILQSDSTIPSLGLTAVKHNLYLLEAEIKLTNELIEEVQHNTTWNHFLAKDTMI